MTRQTELYKRLGTALAALPATEINSIKWLADLVHQCTVYSEQARNGDEHRQALKHLIANIETFVSIQLAEPEEADLYELVTEICAEMNREFEVLL